MATAMIRTEGHPQCGVTVNREALIEEHLPLVKYLAGRACSKLPSSIDVDDLIGAGVLGLMDAAEKFDPARGILFRTYAERRIRGAILDHLRSLDWAPRSLRRRARELEAAHGKLERERGRSVSESEIAEYLEIPLDELQSLTFEINSLQVASLHVPVDSDEDRQSSRELMDRLADTSEMNPFALCAREEMRHLLAAAIDKLPEKERLVISLYYVEELTMKEIGSILGVNESRVSQLHTKAISRLRTSFVHLAA